MRVFSSLFLLDLLLAEMGLDWEGRNLLYSSSTALSRAMLNSAIHIETGFIAFYFPFLSFFFFFNLRTMPSCLVKGIQSRCFFQTSLVFIQFVSFTCKQQRGT